ncbi:cell division protein FtsK [Micrococcus porci]|uniref:FtsK/SpoIIIE domain-containing protein n=1 Tax=Micrococcus porci TaxID=2856555 RepID=UPI001CCE36F5|nr:FtsK/SpoIIIE domain-containing protein [Micrococcus porci]UBH24293.1 cell division protein FtsK [Micrococcus porci]
MTWRVRVLGLPVEQDWAVSELPLDVDGQDRVVAEHFAPLRVERARGGGTTLTYVAHPSGTPPVPAAGSGPELAVGTSAGPDAGRLVPLTAAGLTVGRGRSRMLLDDPQCPSRPVRLALGPSGVSVDDGRTRRTWDGLDGLPIGDSILRLVRGRQRPLPPALTPPPAQIDLGAAPAEQSLLVSLAMAVGPVLIGLVLAVTTRSPLFLLFGIVSLLGVGVLLGVQRRTRRRHADLLRERALDVVRRRVAAVSGPADVSAACRAKAEDRFGLVSARPGDGPALLWGRARGSVAFTRGDVADHWRSAACVDQPVLGVAAADRGTVLCGTGRPAQAAARWTLFQLLRHAVATGSSLVVRSPDGARVWWPAVPGAPTIALELEDTAPLAGAWEVWTASLGAEMSETRRHGCADEVLVRCTGTPPADLDADVVDLDARQATLPGQGLELTDLTPLGISADTLQWWLAELADDVAHLGLGGPPASAPPLRRPHDVGAHRAVRNLAVPLTSSSAGDAAPMVLDLAADGPHALIAGTTGSGKSDLLLSVLVGLAARHAPAEVSFVLLDFKGGASFGPLRRLPHTMSVETNHVGAASLRALQAIGAELRRREALFAEARVADYPAFRAAHPDTALPRLVVAVDELRVLVDEHPDANAVLQRLAATGRSLGFHLLLATQRPGGAVSADVRSNLGTTIALRTATEQESWDLVGSAAASRIDPAAPGTALLARGTGAPVPFRASPWSAGPVRPRWTPWGVPVASAASGTDWPSVVEDLVQACRDRDLPIPEPVVSPPLPGSFAPDRSRRRSADVLALVDDAARARHVPWRWPLGAQGNGAWIVEPAGGRALVLAAVLEAAGRTSPAVLILDGSGECAAALPTVADALPDLADVTLLTPEAQPADVGEQVCGAVADLAAVGGTLVITGWQSWAGVRVGETYRTLDEELHRLLGTQAARGLRVAAVGGRELVTARIAPHLPHRFYVPAGTTPDHRLVWPPKLVEVEQLPGRAVHVHPGGPTVGVPAQLAFPAHSAAGAGTDSDDQQ